MTTRSIVRTLSLVIAVAAFAAGAGTAAAGGDGAPGIFRIPGTDYDVALGDAARPPDDLLARPLLGAIAAWLSRELDLPAIERYPAVAIVSADAITSLRYRGLLPPGSRAGAGAEMARPSTDDTLAIYADDSQTIYLAEGWSGRTPADLSVLVHEMVHHVQNVQGLKHECPQAREKLAYRAQDRWLALFGHSLETDFELDGFSLLVKTGCFY
jgi:Domain of unknown function (DUF6647)